MSEVFALVKVVPFLLTQSLNCKYLKYASLKLHVELEKVDSILPKSRHFMIIWILDRHDFKDPVKGLNLNTVIKLYNLMRTISVYHLWFTSKMFGKSRCGNSIYNGNYWWWPYYWVLKYFNSPVLFLCTHLYH